MSALPGCHVDALGLWLNRRGHDAAEGLFGSANVWMARIVGAEGEYLLVTLEGRCLVVSAVVPQPSLHQPRLGVVRRNFDDSVEEYLRHLPPLVGDCLSSVASKKANSLVPILKFRTLLSAGPNKPLHVSECHYQ